MKRASALVLSIGPLAATVLALSTEPLPVLAAGSEPVELCMEEAPMSRADIREDLPTTCAASACLDISEDGKTSDTISIPIPPPIPCLPASGLVPGEEADGELGTAAPPGTPSIFIENTVVRRE